ncbi:MAG TPA: HAD family hydrolase [Dehalococcoidia bacterium]|nr:HAD family hydrolase [Dehalococcoidia bacterium]
MKVRAVLFDLGYTLWDVDYSGETQAYETLRRRLARETGEPVPPAEKLRAAVSAVFRRETVAWLHGKLEQKPTAEIYGEGFETLGLDVSAEVLGRIAEAALFRSIRYTVDPETPRVLAALKERGLLVGAVSNTYQSSRALEKSLVKHGLMQYIDTLVVSSEVGWEKPHPAIFREALRRLGVEAKETVFVGDIVWADIQGAQALGMKAVLTHQYRQEDPGEAKPDLVVKRLAEVVDYVDRLNGDAGRW